MAAFTLGNPAAAPRPPAAYSHVARIDLGNVVLLTLAGQLPLGDDGALVGEGDMAAQTRRVFEIITVLLAEHGADLGDLVNLRTFLTDMDQLGAHIAARNPLLAEPRPTSTTVEVSRLARPGALVEVEATAVVAKP